MKDTKKKYWKGFEELSDDAKYLEDAKNEFPEYLPVSEGEGTNRRDFLKLLGFGVAAASLAACEAPVKKAIPYLNKPETIDPGVPNYYASTYAEGGDYCSILVKTREGRPIKIEGNKLSTITNGGTSARVQASVLSLYDNSEYRAKKPQAEGKDSSWKAIDGEIISKLDEISSNGGQIRIVSNTILSPSKKKAIASFTNKYPGAKHVTYDATSYSGILDAQKIVSGTRAIPGYDFSKAKTIVSVNADFLGTWISPIEYANQYSKGKKIGNKNNNMSKHYQFESRMSLTGSNADSRIKIRPSQEGSTVAAIYSAVASAMGGESISAPKGVDVSEAAKALIAAKGNGLLVSGSNDVNVQILVAKTNALLNTKAISGTSNYKQGNDAVMSSFVEQMKGGAISGVVFLDCNPVYDYLRGTELAKTIKGLKLSVSTSGIIDETAVLTQYVAPKSHYLESWTDAEPKMNSYSLGQPAIKTIFDTREELESILTWSGDNTTAYDYIRSYWSENITSDWDKALHDGVYVSSNSTMAAALGLSDEAEPVEGEESEVVETVSSGSASEAAANIKSASTGTELEVYEKVTMGAGKEGNNPWLQECPDPITKTVWDNYAVVSLKMAKELDLSQTRGGEANSSDMVSVSDGEYSIDLPVIIQPGQDESTVAIAKGYGRTRAGRAGNNVGGNATYFNTTAKIQVTKADGGRIIARTQTSSTAMDREAVIQASTLTEFKKDPAAGRYYPMMADATGDKKKPAAFDLFWQKHDYNNHHWGMVIDLNSCTGCSACVIACHAENNVPVVGREEVINRRDMHWMRIDRYYSSEMTHEKAKEEGLTGLGGTIDKYHQMEVASENPEVTHQPMMCQHCNHAGCETVCPVAATTHSSEGLNQMAYNRCIGTRYCANNCAYKVRRFNWFNYAEGDYSGDNAVLDSKREFFDLNPVRNDLGRMVLNPDVVVRTRGVMEKCSMCVQRIQYGKLEAKKEGRRPTDNDVVSACAQACPTNAITFGDMNNPESAISNALKGEQKERAYVVLEELNTQPNVSYLTKIRNNA